MLKAARKTKKPVRKVAKAKTRAKKIAAKAKPQLPERNFMARLLEKKNAEIKQKELMRKNSGPAAWEPQLATLPAGQGIKRKAG